MKNQFFYTMILFSLFACKPKTGDYSCTCDISPTGGTKKTVKDTIQDKTASDASTLCNDWGNRLINGNGSYNCVTKPL